MTSVKFSIVGIQDRQSKISKFGVLTKVIVNQISSIKITEILCF
jgi:hypothetical protein